MASSDSDEDDSDADAERIARAREMAVSLPKPSQTSAGEAGAEATGGSKLAGAKSRDTAVGANGGRDPRMTSTPPTDGLSKQERKRIKKARQRAEKRQRKEQQAQLQAEGQSTAKSGQPATAANGSIHIHKADEKDKTPKKKKVRPCQF